jgi:polyferredoxin
MADLIALLHGAYALFVLAGTVLIVSGMILGWRWVREPRFRTLHLAAVLFVAFRAVAGLSCPLTVLENHFRSAPSETALIRWAHTAALRDEDPERFTRGSVTLAVVVLGLYFAGGSSLYWPFSKGTLVPSGNKATTRSSRQT